MILVGLRTRKRVTSNGKTSTSLDLFHPQCDEENQPSVLACKVPLTLSRLRRERCGTKSPQFGHLSVQIRTTQGATTAVKSLGHDTVHMINELADRSERSAARMSMHSQIRQSEQSISLGRLAFKIDGLTACTKQYKVSSSPVFGSTTLFATTYSTG